MIEINPKNLIYCTRYPQDTTIPGIKFDENGVCNFCHLHDKLEKLFPSGEKGKEILDLVFAKIKNTAVW